MKSTFASLAALFLAATAVGSSHANGLCGPAGCAPQGCGPGGGSQMYRPTPPPVYPYGGGPWNGPCYWVQPPCPPFNGVLPPMNQGGQQMGGCPLPTHPYIRSPRDYFMYYDRD